MMARPDREKALRAIYADRSWEGTVAAIYSPACPVCGDRAWCASNAMRGGFERGGFWCSSCDGNFRTTVAPKALVPQIEDAIISQRG